MTIRSIYIASCICFIFLISNSGTFEASTGKSRPNFVFILVDDLGWKDLGCYGSEFYETPNIDRLAGQGTRFTNAYAASPVCSPTRASIMTGKHPARIGITDWIPGRNPEGTKLLGPSDLHALPLEEVTIADALKKAGYRTFFAGKWHLGGKDYYPENQGFDINKGGHEKGSPPGGYYSPYKNPKLENGSDGEYLPDRLTDESIRFLEMLREEPFLLYLSFYTVHTPIQASKRHLDHFQKKSAKLDEIKKDEGFMPERNAWTKQRQDNADYASMVYAMDENVGRLLSKLDELKLADRTIVIFMSDNGGLSTRSSKRSPTSVLPLRAGKGWCYEGGIRVPMIIRAPGVNIPGDVCQTPVTSHDFYPTMLELAGLPLQPTQHVDGISFVPLLKGKQSLERNAIFWHYPHYHGSTWTPGAAVRSGDWKLIEFYEEDKVELYNLKLDIGERKDLSLEEPEKTRELRKMLSDWQKSINAQLPILNPDFSE